MSETDYAAVLTSIRPGASWSISGNDWTTLQWFDESAAPSQAECDAAWPQVQYDLAYAQVQAERHAAYVSDADPLFFRWQRGQGTEQAWLNAVAAVDAAHPYPDPL
jgi:hypothetical protein